MTPDKLDRWIPLYDALEALGNLRQAGFTSKQRNYVTYWTHPTWAERYEHRYAPIHRTYYITQTAGERV